VSAQEIYIGGNRGLRYICAMAASTHAKHRRECRFSGRVQGVGFRYTVKNLAMQYDVHGYVRNLPDGRVELVMEGPDEEMIHLLDDVSRKMNNYIQGVDQTVANATGEFDYFAIRH
jgi:acylphosphatase